ncbi:MAG: hypothetical protein ACRCTK_01650 [Alphaproteobacteria bacterium]
MEKLTPEQLDTVKRAYGSDNPSDKRGFLGHQYQNLDNLKTELDQKLNINPPMSYDDFRLILQDLGYGKNHHQNLEGFKKKMREFFTGKLNENEMKALEEYLSGKAPPLPGHNVPPSAPPLEVKGSEQPTCPTR